MISALNSGFAGALILRLARNLSICVARILKAGSSAFFSGLPDNVLKLIGLIWRPFFSTS